MEYRMATWRRENTPASKPSAYEKALLGIEEGIIALEGIQDPKAEKAFEALKKVHRQVRRARKG